MGNELSKAVNSAKELKTKKRTATPKQNKKLMLWKMLDKKLKDSFVQMESDFKDVDLN